jgi:hypothetical protein
MLSIGVPVGDPSATTEVVRRELDVCRADVLLRAVKLSGSGFFAEKRGTMVMTR